MHPIKEKGTLSIRGLTVFCVLIALLVYEVHSQTADNQTEELSYIKARYDSLLERYKHLCSQYSSLPENCAGPVIKCTDCPVGWFNVGDQCFLLNADKHDWFNSTVKCKEIGGHLAILTTKKQHETLEVEARKLGLFYTNYWIGLNDIENEGDWKWVDNSTLQTPFWSKLKPEPDNHPSAGEEGEDCAVVDSYTHNWYDVPCSFSFPRICQMDAIPFH
ncbi:perlucin-like protein [Pholidichthys leucotaenia]